MLSLSGVKILLLNQHVHDVVGGSEIQCDFIARDLAKRGHEVTYGAFSGRHSHYDVPYHCRALAPYDPLALRQLLHRVEADLVYWRFNLKGFFRSAREIRRFGSALVLAVSHESDVQRFPSRARKKGLLGILRHTFNYGGYRYVDGVASQNADLLKQVPVARRVLLRNLMNERAEPFAWPRPYVAWVSNLKPRKKPECVIELAKRLSGLDFVLVGAVQSKAYEYFRDPDRLPPNVYYLGARSLEEINGIVGGACLLAHTCEPEGFPNIFVQAWLQAKPTISLSFDPDGVIEREGLGSLCVTMDRFAERIQGLVDDSHELRSIGERARRYATERHSITDNVLCVEQFFADILRQHRADEAVQSDFSENDR